VKLRPGTPTQKTEDRRQKTEDRGQRTEDRRQRTEDRGQLTVLDVYGVILKINDTAELLLGVPGGAIGTAAV
jgi:hypothetical protein